MSRDNPLSRRRFLQSAAACAAAVAVSPVLCRRPAWAAGGGGARPGKFLVVVNLIGGNDALNTVVPTGIAAYRSQRPTLNLIDNLPAGESLLDLDGGSHAFHYAMPGMQQIWNDGDLAIVGNVSYPDPNQSHFTSREIYSFGVRDYKFSGDGRGWLGRFADCYWSNPSDPLGVISVGLDKLPDFRADTTNPLVLWDVPGFSVYPDWDHFDDHGLREGLARNILATDPPPTQPAGASIFQARAESYSLVDQVQADTAGWVDPGTYPRSSIGDRLLTISQLMHAQSTWGTQVYYTGRGGFDTHDGQHSSTGGQNLHESLLRSLDDALVAFADDMKAQGRWNDCCILLISEFGRRTFENGSSGTDHGHGSMSMVLGGAVQGRLAPGGGITSAPTEAEILADWLPFEHDFRDIYGHIVQTHLGLDPNPLFPDPQYVPNLSAVDLVT